MKRTVNLVYVKKLVTALGTMSLVCASLIAMPTAAQAATATATVNDSISVSDILNGGQTALTLAQNLQGTGVSSVSSATFVGGDAQAAIATMPDRNVVGFNQGVLLSTGDAVNAIGPNKSGGSGNYVVSNGDAFLNNLIKTSTTANPTTYDAAVLEFNFVPNASTVYFTYTFASDEYPQSANLYNDVFAAVVNATNSTNGTNCATVPNPAGGTSAPLPISAGSINSTTNASLFRNNSFSTPPAHPIDIEYDGLSVELICSATVTPNVNNKIKFVIADTSNGFIDSAVFIKSHSLSTVAPESCNNGVDDNGNGKIDGADPQCIASTAAAPQGQEGIGGITTQPLPPAPTNLPNLTGYTGTPAYSGAPAFTGNEGTPILLDAAAVGIWPSGGTYYALWSVAAVGATTGFCDVSISDPVAQNSDGSIGLDFAVCSDEGEYVATATGLFSSDPTSTTGFTADIHFFVHNAPPAVDLVSPVAAAINYVGSAPAKSSYSVNFTAHMFDPGFGISDGVTCTIDFGDGNVVDAVFDPVTGNCTGTNNYLMSNPLIVSNQVVAVIYGSDGNQATSSATTIVNFNPPPVVVKKNQKITISPAVPASSTYGTVLTIGATSDSGLGVIITTTTPTVCTASGNLVTIIASAGTCTIAANVPATVDFNAAPQVTASVTAGKRPITVTATAVSKIYGAADPAIPYTITSGSLAATDAFSGALARAAGTAVGNYAINQGTLTVINSTTSANVLANYTLTFVATNIFFSITGATPVITLAPASRTVMPATSVTLTVAATGSPAPTVQWQRQPAGGTFANIVGATASSYAPPTSAADDGISYRAIFTNALGSATTSAATINVISITSLSTSTVTAGSSTLTINGTGLSAIQAIRFVAAQTSSFTVVNAKQITVAVPAAAKTGKVSVVQGLFIASSATDLTVNPPAVTPTAAMRPIVTSFMPRAAQAGATVTIIGANLTGTTSVSFGSTASPSFIVLSSTKLLATVPIGAKSGIITLTHGSGNAVMAGFVVLDGQALPKISSVSLVSKTANTSAKLLLSGLNLGSANRITLNNVSLAFTVISANQVQVTVPINTANIAQWLNPLVISNGATTSVVGRRLQVQNWP